MKLQITSEQYAQLSDGLKGATAAAGALEQAVNMTAISQADHTAHVRERLAACLKKCQEVAGTLVVGDENPPQDDPEDYLKLVSGDRLTCEICGSGEATVYLAACDPCVQKLTAKSAARAGG